MTSDASDKVDSVVTLDVCDAQDFFEDVLVDDLSVKLGNWRSIVDFVRFDRHDMPFVVNVEAVGVFALNLRGLTISQRSNDEIFLQGSLELFSGHIVQRFEYSVVIEDHKIVSWIEKSHEVVEWLLSCNFNSCVNGALFS